MASLFALLVAAAVPKREAFGTELSKFCPFCIAKLPDQRPTAERTRIARGNGQLETI